MKERASGILMHISSLTGAYGIGDFGKGAYAFLDFLEAAEQRYWQILPIGITGYGDSPYQSFSAFAGNPYFIDLDALIESGYLKASEVRRARLGSAGEAVDYQALYERKMPLLKKAYARAYTDKRFMQGLDAFYRAEQSWLETFALFMALKESHGGVSWRQWPKGFENPNTEAVQLFGRRHQKDVFFWVFTQYYVFMQWHALRDAAAAKGIQIIGDVPIYVAEDSADVWSHPELFKLDEKRRPISVSGCPPDAFSDTGQLWGNPIYNWAHMDATGYAWWVTRINYSLKLFDVIRVDHFRGFEAYWEVPYGDKTAQNGQWVKAPGRALFEAVYAALGDVNIIAEDLGFVTQEVLELRDAFGFPGMKVLQFAFDAREESDYLPHNYVQNSVAYTGTHDNETAAGWMQSVRGADRRFAERYLRLNEAEGYHWGFIRGAWSSVSYLAIAQMQDFLGLDNSARMNYPSSLGGNWQWRVPKRALTKKLSRKIADLTRLYGRSARPLKTPVDK